MSAVFIASLDASASVTDQNFETFLTSQIWFVAFLDTEIAGIVALGVVVIVLNVFCRYFTDIAEHVGGRRVVVLS